MSSWAKKRQIGYLSGILAVFALLVSVPLYSYITKPPTCFDGKQNGEEGGVDCGGICMVQCLTDVSDPIIHWARAFKVEDGLYDVAALIENINDVGTSEMLYQFKMYDENNLLIQDRMGKSFALPHDKWVIFEGRINTGEREPNRVFIEFVEAGTWVQMDIAEEDMPTLSVTGQRLEEKNGMPRLSATISNKSPFPIDAIEVVALISDAEENTLGVSRTYIETLPKYGDETVVFTWREPFADVPAKIDIFPRVNYVADIPLTY
jgi:hypothetical protein